MAFASSTSLRTSTFFASLHDITTCEVHSPAVFAQRHTKFQVRATAGPPQRRSDEGKSQGPFSAARDFLAGIRRATGFTSDGVAEEFDDDRMQVFSPEDAPPEVLIIGATGRTGRIIARKLVLRGYRVRVLVRNLYSATLDVVGTGVSYVKGDLLDYESLLEATADADKIICVAGVGTGSDVDVESIEYDGVANLIRAFHDSRIQLYGRTEATKLVLFNFATEPHLAKWKRVVPEQGDEGAKPPRVNFQVTGGNRVAFMGQIFSTYSGVAEVRTIPSRLNLRAFAGLVLRCIGDGKDYCIIVRTAEGVRAGVEYVGTFPSRQNKWESVRLPFDTFVPISLTDGEVDSDAPKLDKTDIRQIAMQFRKPAENPEKDDGKFYLGVDYMKAYRSQNEPDFVLVSCASVTSRDFSGLDEKGLRAAAKDDVAAWKYLAEKRLRQSGLTYCIVRPGAFTEQPGGNKALMLEQDANMSGAISRADLAEICVSALIDSRACNVTFDAFESMYAPSAQIPQQDVSSMLGRLRQNT